MFALSTVFLSLRRQGLLLLLLSRGLLLLLWSRCTRTVVALEQVSVGDMTTVTIRQTTPFGVLSWSPSKTTTTTTTMHKQ